MQKSLAFVLGTSCTLVMSTQVGAATFSLINGSFETGDLTGWETTGIAEVKDNAFGVNPYQGTWQGFSETPDDAASSKPTAQALEQFLGITQGSLNNSLRNED